MKPSPTHHPSLTRVQQRRIYLRFLIIVALCFAIVSSLLKTYEILIERTQLIDNLNQLFNVNHHGSGIPAWYNISLIMAVIVLCYRIAISVIHQKTRYQYYWLLLGFLFSVLLIVKSTDIISAARYWVQLAISRRLFYVGLGSAALVFVILLPAFIREGVTFHLTFPAETRRWFVFGIAIFLFGAIILEKIGSTIWFMTYSPNLVYEYLGSCEEFSEMLGLILIQYALLGYLTTIETKH